MIKLACEVPADIVLAVSGGPDSMALYSFFKQGKRNITVIHFNHGGSEFSHESERLVRDYCRGSNVWVRNLSANKTESEWSEIRRETYGFQKHTVCTAHHLDDAVEWWMITSMRGNPHLMPIVSGNVIRPFILTEKTALTDWCERHSVPYIIDPETYSTRAKLRTAVMPMLHEINPGLRTTIRNKYSRSNLL